MLSFVRIIRWLPLSQEAKLAWSRDWLDWSYAKDIAVARKANDRARAQSLEENRQFEIDLHDEDEDAHITKTLLRTARRLRVPIPHRYNGDRSESDLWYEGRFTGRWCLTSKGVSAVREEIRRELKARHEAKSHWVVWLSALTGLVGAVAGLVALLLHKS